MNEYFDKRIDLIFYSEKGKTLGYLNTPDVGEKPDITIRGTMISEDSSISVDVTVTNLERDFPIDAVAWIKATCYYGRTMAEGSAKSFLMYILYADQSKGPPNRQVVFKCVFSSSEPNLFNKTVSFNYAKEGKAVDRPLDSVLKDFLAQCREIQASMDYVKYGGDIRTFVQLTEEPKYIGDQTLKNATVLMGYWSGTVYEFLSFIQAQFYDKEPASEGSDLIHKFLRLHVYFENNTLVVQKNPSYTEPFVDYGNAKIRLKHVLSMYRRGPIVHLKTLFDPRISQTTSITISSYNMGGAKSLGKLVPLEKTELVRFTPIGGIQFEFGTVNGNSMEMQGVYEIASEEKVLRLRR